MTRNRIAMKRIVIVVCILALAGLVVYRRREQHLARLFSQATALTSTDDALDAVRELNTYGGTRVTSMLLTIGRGQVGFSPDVRLEAIKALGMRNDPSIATRLARLLQPYETLEIRQAVADTLAPRACSVECIESILHYLERVYRGERNAEHQIVVYPRESVHQELLEREEALYKVLHGILVSQSIITIAALEEVHGLGTDLPSDFSLDLLTRIVLPDSCSLLLKAEEVRRLPGVYISSSERLRSAMIHQGCNSGEPQ